MKFYNDFLNSILKTENSFTNVMHKSDNKTWDTWEQHIDMMSLWNKYHSLVFSARKNKMNTPCNKMYFLWKEHNQKCTRSGVPQKKVQAITLQSQFKTDILGQNVHNIHQNGAWNCQKTMLKMFPETTLVLKSVFDHFWLHQSYKGM